MEIQMASCVWLVCYALRYSAHHASRSLFRTIETRFAHRSFSGGALIGAIGGLIGLGGAEFRLPLLMAGCRMAGDKSRGRPVACKWNICPRQAPEIRCRDCTGIVAPDRLGTERGGTRARFSTQGRTHNGRHSNSWTCGHIASDQSCRDSVEPNIASSRTAPEEVACTANIVYGNGACY